jgi:hypothetical protein
MGYAGKGPGENFCGSYVSAVAAVEQIELVGDRIQVQNRNSQITRFEKQGVACHDRAY